MTSKNLCFLLGLSLFGLLSNCSNESQTEIKPLQDGVEESYKPDHAIEFSHEVHTKIDCKYCHSSAIDGKKEGIPTVSICMNCHGPKDGNTRD